MSCSKKFCKILTPPSAINHPLFIAEEQNSSSFVLSFISALITKEHTFVSPLMRNRDLMNIETEYHMTGTERKSQLRLVQIEKENRIGLQIIFSFWSFFSFTGIWYTERNFHHD